MIDEGELYLLINHEEYNFLTDHFWTYKFSEPASTQWVK